MQHYTKIFRGLWFYITFLWDCRKGKKKIIKIQEYFASLDDSSRDKKNYIEYAKTVAVQRSEQRRMKRFFAAQDIIVTHKNLDSIPRDGRCIIIMNHNSFMDIMTTFPFLPACKFISKASLAKIPYLGTIVKAGSVLVDRKDDKSKARAYAHMSRLPEMGIIPVFFPEGTRNTKLYPLLAFHPGAAILAKKRKLPVYMGVIFGSATILPRGISFTPGHVDIHMLGPYIADEQESADEFSERLRNTMQEYIVKHG